MIICKFCGNEVTKYVRREYCSEQCYQKMYYRLHREHKRAYDKAKYVPHPRKKIIRTEEEIKQLEEQRLTRRRQYYLDNREYYRQKNREYYLLHKDDPEYRRKHNEATKRYLKRRKENG